MLEQIKAKLKNQASEDVQEEKEARAIEKQVSESKSLGVKGLEEDSLIQLRVHSKDEEEEDSDEDEDEEAEEDQEKQKVESKKETKNQSKSSQK